MTIRRETRASRAALLAVLLALLPACAKRAPVEVAFVDDRAAMLTRAEEASITTWHEALLEQYSIDYRVLTVRDVDDLAAYAVRHFEEGGVGRQSGAGRGLLLVVDAEGERVRLEVARELEGVFVDAFVAFVEREQMAPFFAAGRVGDGIVATTELIAGRAEEAIERGELQWRGAEASSAGAGAEGAASVGSGYLRPAATDHVDGTAGETPLDTVAAYLAAMAAHDGSPELDLYTAGTRKMMKGHVVTRAQMDNMVRTYRDCPGAQARESGDVAVVEHPGESGRCAPWFLRRGADGLWRLDLLTMQRTVRFDTRNRWHIAAPESLGDYAFAFESQE